MLRLNLHQIAMQTIALMHIEKRRRKPKAFAYSSGTRIAVGIINGMIKPKQKNASTMVVPCHTLIQTHQHNIQCRVLEP